MGLLLLLLADPARHRAVLYHPSTVPLSHQGYKLVSATSDTAAMVVFLKRVIASMNGRVLSELRLRELAAFASHRGKPVTSYNSLKLQLKAIGSRSWSDLGRGEPEGIVSFNAGPLPAGTLIQSRSGRAGVIEDCKQGRNSTSMEYKVSFRRSSRLTKSNSNLDVTDGIEEHQSDIDLKRRVDVRWLSNPAVISLVPYPLQDRLTMWLGRIQRWRRVLRGISRCMRDIVCWKDQVRSFGAAGSLLLLSLLFMLLQRVFLLVAFSILFAMSTRRWTEAVAWRRAANRQRSSACQSTPQWCFFLGGQLGDEEHRSKSLATSTILSSTADTLLFRSRKSAIAAETSELSARKEPDIASQKPSNGYGGSSYFPWACCVQRDDEPQTARGEPSWSRSNGSPAPPFPRAD
jgi:hypothetical protein